VRGLAREHLRDTEIDEARDAGRLVQDDVRRIDVAVHDVQAVDPSQRVGDLQDDAQRLFEREAPVAQDHRERTRAEVLEHQPELRVKLVDPNDAVARGGERHVELPSDGGELRNRRTALSQLLQNDRRAIGSATSA